MITKIIKKIFRDQFLIVVEFFETRFILCISMSLYNMLLLVNVYRAATAAIRHWLHYVSSSTTTMNTT